MSAPISRRWLSQGEAADYLGVTTRSIRNLISRGDLPARRLGSRMVRIDRADLERALRPVSTADGGGSA